MPSAQKEPSGDDGQRRLSGELLMRRTTTGNLENDERVGRATFHHYGVAGRERVQRGARGVGRRQRREALRGPARATAGTMRSVRVWPASHGLRYTTFFGGDGRHAVGFFNPWLACSSRLVLDRTVVYSTYVCEAGCARLPIQSLPASASDAVSPRGNARLAGRREARCWFKGPIWQTNEFRSSFPGPIGRKTSFGVVETLSA